MAKAIAKLQTPGGLYPSSYGSDKPAIRGEIEIDTEITFSEPFCGLHPGQSTYNNVCEKCDEQIISVVKHHVLVERGSLSCELLSHDHECSCHLGHDCHENCNERQRIAQEVTKGESDSDFEALATIAAEAPSDVMLGVFSRLAKLEEENTALKQALTSLVKALPEDVREAARCLEVLARA